MKKMELIYWMFFMATVASYGQKKSTIYLNEIDKQLSEDISYQGIRLFHKSDCFNKSKTYSIIPFFNVESDISLDSLSFSEGNTLLNTMRFKRSSTRKLLNEVSWIVIGTQDNLQISSSDHKRFYCYKPHYPIFDFVYVAVEKLGIENINYFFYILGTDGFLKFIVDKNNNIYSYHSKLKMWLGLGEFSEFYENGNIGRFSDNPFKD